MIKTTMNVDESSGVMPKSIDSRHGESSALAEHGSHHFDALSADCHSLCLAGLRSTAQTNVCPSQYV
jgi:hypothetical protein